MSFVRAFSLPATPVTPEKATLFVAFLGSEGLCVSTIESYLAALQHFQVLSDPSCMLPSFHSPHMKVLLQGIRRDQAQQGPARVRLPITASLLQRIKSHLSNDPSAFLNVLIWSACCVGFFGFLRCGEFLIPDSQQFDANRHLSLADVTLDKSPPQWRYYLFISSSKTDQFQQSSQVVLGATGSDLCPVAALLDYLSLRGDVAGPLFLQQDGHPLHRSFFMQKVQDALTATGLTGTSFNSHSFRIGAATTAGVAGVPEATIKVLGRWKSGAYQQYIHPSAGDLAQVSTQLCKE